MTATQIYCYNVKAALDDMQVNLDENCRWLPRNTNVKCTFSACFMLPLSQDHEVALPPLYRLRK